MTIDSPCLNCKEIQIIKLFDKDYLRWKAGENAQIVFHYLTKDEIEFLTSYTCIKCLDKMHGDGEKR